MLEEFVVWCRSKKRQLQIDDATCDVLHRLVEAYRSECSSSDEPPQIKLVHQCRSNACDINNTSCQLCKNTLVKKCTRLVKHRYRDVEPVQALCKGLVTCQLPEVPGTVTDQVTHFRAYLVDSSLYEELKSQRGREPRWSELQDPHSRIIIRQNGQAANGIFQRVPSDHFPLATTRQQGVITADIGGSGQSMVILVSSQKFTVRRKLGHFRLLVVAGREAPGDGTSTEADSVIDSILPAVTEPFKVGTAPYVEEPLKMSYPMGRLYGIGRNLELVFHDLRAKAAKWTDTELASKVVACLGPQQSGIETVEEFLQFATRLSAEPPVFDRLKTLLNGARLHEAVEHARQAVHPDSVPRIFTPPATAEGSWGLVYAVEDGGLQLDAGPIEYIFQAADGTRTQFEPRSKEATARQDLLRDLHAQARASWFQDGHRYWSCVTMPPAPAPRPSPPGPSDGTPWAPGPSRRQQQPSPGPSRHGPRARQAQQQQQQQPAPPLVAHPGAYQPVPVQYLDEYQDGSQLPPLGQASTDEMFMNAILERAASPTHAGLPASEPPPFVPFIGPPSPSWPSHAPSRSAARNPMLRTRAPPEALAFLSSSSSSPTASSPTNLPPSHSSPPPSTDLPSLDAGIGPRSPSSPPPSAFTAPDLAALMPATQSAPPNGPSPYPPVSMGALGPVASDPYPRHAGHHAPPPLAPANHHQAPLAPEFAFNALPTRTITTTNHAPRTFPTASTSPTVPPAAFPPHPLDVPFGPLGEPPLQSPWVPQPVPNSAPQLGSTPTQGLATAAGFSPFHYCPPETRQHFPKLQDEEPEELDAAAEQLQNSSLDPPAPQDPGAGASQQRAGGKRAPPAEGRPGDPNTSTHHMLRPAMRQRNPGGAASGSGQQGAPTNGGPLLLGDPASSDFVLLNSSMLLDMAITPSFGMDIEGLEDLAPLGGAAPDDSD